MNYAELYGWARRLAGWLAAEAKAGPHERVAIAMANRPEVAIAYWGAQLCGAVAMPLNFRAGRQAVEHMLREGEPAALICDAAAWRLIEPAWKGAGLECRLVAVDFAAEGAVEWQAALSAKPLPEPVSTDPLDPAIILYTSGTTGLAKGAIMPRQAIEFNVRMAIIAHSLRHEDVHLLAIPFFVPTACYTLINASAYLGATLCTAPAPDIPGLLRLIERFGCTTFFGVPTMFAMLCSHRGVRERDLSSLRLVAYSGSPMPVRTIRQLRQLLPGVWLHNFFGLTETIAMTHVLFDQYADEKPESIGKLLPEIDAQIVDEDGQPLPPGQVGELCFHRSVVIPAYFRRPGLLEENIRGEWFHTGDLASVDEDGFFFLHGRSKDLIIVAGQNVYALEVEQVIMRMEKVREVAVVGVPARGSRAALGELIKAVVVPHPGEQISEMEVKRHCAQHLPSYKVPHIVEFRDELPRNPAGKVLKRLLAEEPSEAAERGGEQ